MDQIAVLFLSRTAQPIRWEDEEKATNDVELLREEFRRRLYGNAEAPARERNGSTPAEQK